MEEEEEEGNMVDDIGRQLPRQPFSFLFSFFLPYFIYFVIIYSRGPGDEAC